MIHGIATGRGGSSPRVRGKRSTCSCPPAGRGLIPARAGKTLRLRGERLAPRAHPRACGENRTRGVWTPGFVGSSPRVRGKRRTPRARRRQPGLIPARAGKTSRRLIPGRAPWAHPRACGENNRIMGTRWLMPGSSPRVRGKHPRAHSTTSTSGLIPARAGKTRSRPAPTAGSPAHPRACGGNRTRGVTTPGFVGSSPRVRGKRRSPWSQWRSPGAHPRACGENVRPPPRERRSAGSSPRVQGKPVRSADLGGGARLIPARAGKTRRRPARW